MIHVREEKPAISMGYFRTFRCPESHWRARAPRCTRTPRFRLACAVNTRQSPLPWPQQSRLSEFRHPSPASCVSIPCQARRPPPPPATGKGHPVDFRSPRLALVFPIALSCGPAIGGELPGDHFQTVSRGGVSPLIWLEKFRVPRPGSKPDQNGQFRPCTFRLP
jgi:hypothetical protein